MNFNQKPFIAYRPFFILIILGLIAVSYQFIDIPLAQFFSSFHLPYLVDKTAYFLASWGFSGRYFIAFPLIALLAFHYHRINVARACIFLFICVAFSGIVCCMLKIIFGRARPDEFFTLSSYGFYWLKFNAYYWSFPSGHTTTFFSVMLGLCVIKPRWSTGFVILAVLVSFMRVFLAKHYLSDIIAGFYLALICVHAVRAFYQRKGYNLGSFGSR